MDKSYLVCCSIRNAKYIYLINYETVVATGPTWLFIPMSLERSNNIGSFIAVYLVYWRQSVETESFLWDKKYHIWPNYETRKLLKSENQSWRRCPLSLSMICPSLSDSSWAGTSSYEEKSKINNRCYFGLVSPKLIVI